MIPCHVAEIVDIAEISVQDFAHVEVGIAGTVIDALHLPVLCRRPWSGTLACTVLTEACELFHGR